MAIATSTAIALALAAASAGANYYNTTKTASRQDAALADSIRNQSAKQKEADAKVNAEVTNLEGSSSADEQAKRLSQYMDTLRTSRGKLQAGLTPAVGSAAFKADAAGDANDVLQYSGDTAGLLSRMDAANLQRQGEGFGYGNLATDLGLIQRGAQGQNFLDELRIKRAGRRSPWLDALSAGLSGAASGVGGAGAAAGGTSTSVMNPITGAIMYGG